MAIQVRFIEVIIRKNAIVDKVPGGIGQIAALCANRTLRQDQKFMGMSFMNPLDCENLVPALEAAGLTHLKNGACEDIAVFDYFGGPTMPCHWADLELLPWNGRKRLMFEWPVARPEMQ